MDKQGKEHDLQNEMMSRRKHHNAFGTNERVESREQRREQQLLSQLNLKEPP